MSTLAPEDIQHVRELCAEISDGRVVHDSRSDRHDGWDSFCQVYAWLPGNLFIGPRDRVDDPGEKFEKDAGPIFSSAGRVAPLFVAPLFESLSFISEKISRYLNPASRQPQLAKEAYGQLAKVARRARYINFKECHWKWEKDPGELEKLKSKGRKPGPRIIPSVDPQPSSSSVP